MTSRLTMAIPLNEKRSWPRTLGQSTVGCASIGALTGIAYWLHLPPATVGFTYLAAVVVISLFFGIWQATLVSVVAVSCLNFFFTAPIFSFSVSDERDWIALVSFQVCALLVSRLSSREQKLAKEANHQRIQMKKLYELSRGILLFNLHGRPGPQLVTLIRRIFLVTDVAIFDGQLAQLDHEGEWSEEERQIAKRAYANDKSADDFDSLTTQRLIRMGSVAVGAIAIRGEVDPLIANAIASLAAIAFERHRSYESASRAESAQQAEQLRVAVLDALAHAFKTPLTVICTASSGLMELGTLDQSEAELAHLINEESVNLNQLCTRLLQTAKLDVLSATPRTAPVVISAMVHDVLDELASTLAGHRVEVSIDEREIPLVGDKELLTMVLTQYLDNAAKYAAPDTPISIHIRESDSELILAVHNRGPAIELDDRERVFERFYRGADARGSVPGTGLGLSIVRKAAEAHRGHVWVVSAEHEGTTFFLSMPRVRAEVKATWNRD